MKDNPNYSVEYIKLATFMSDQITECILFLTTKGRAYRETVSGIAQLLNDMIAVERVKNVANERDYIGSVT